MKAFACWHGVTLKLESVSNKPFDDFLLSAQHTESDGDLVCWHFPVQAVPQHPTLFGKDGCNVCLLFSLLNTYELNPCFYIKDLI